MGSRAVRTVEYRLAWSPVMSTGGSRVGSRAVRTVEYRLAWSLVMSTGGAGWAAEG